jgi:hypothetical protein
MIVSILIDFARTIRASDTVGLYTRCREARLQSGYVIQGLSRR